METRCTKCKRTTSEAGGLIKPVTKFGDMVRDWYCEACADAKYGADRHAKYEARWRAARGR